jgi:hypothetical protein
MKVLTTSSVLASLRALVDPDTAAESYFVDTMLGGLVI